MSQSSSEAKAAPGRPEAVWLRRTPSTNDEVKKLALAGAPEWTAVVADRQDAGRGRLGRSWHSDGPWGLWASYLLRPRLEPEKAPFLGILAGLAAALAIRRLTGLAALVKWPNDVQVDGLKVCGVLPEAGIGPSGLEWVVIGAGMNLNEPPHPMPDEIRARATTLEALCGKRIERSAMLSEMLDIMQGLYDGFVSGGPDRALDLAGRMSALGEGVITVLEGGKSYGAKALGMDEYGALLVEDDCGRRRRLLSAEVSIRRR
ncbi:MAG TPA: biotin--[acetyl-CoA-carboxylase] ligase [Bacillota bacterium]|nr:biotin--[acetyl-CoA-carboxylase] ligase [Bacillota bacterium]